MSKLTTYPYHFVRRELRSHAAALYLISYGSPWPGRRLFDGGCRFTFGDYTNTNANSTNTNTTLTNTNTY